VDCCNDPPKKRVVDPPCGVTEGYFRGVLHCSWRGKTPGRRLNSNFSKKKREKIEKKKFPNFSFPIAIFPKSLVRKISKKKLVSTNHAKPPGTVQCKQSFCSAEKTPDLLCLRFVVSGLRI